MKSGKYKSRSEVVREAIKILAVSMYSSIATLISFKDSSAINVLTVNLTTQPTSS
ncbi:hypothetical protein [Archaeoglobus sulfaticallidus]|uniref:hypothetical protein n=1 Tax=Archaeoglobus sulfaticallidus TaxID=1316941 RepID=UPI00146164F0